MSEESEIVDAFDNLQNEKKKIEEKIEEIRKRIIKLAKEKNKEFIFGSNKLCSIKEFEKVIYPEDKEPLISLIKQKGLYGQFSSINYFKLSPKILKGEIDREIIALTKKEKDYRVSLKDKKVLTVS